MTFNFGKLTAVLLYICMNIKLECTLGGCILYGYSEGVCNRVQMMTQTVSCRCLDERNSLRAFYVDFMNQTNMG